MAALHCLRPIQIPCDNYMNREAPYAKTIAFLCSVLLQYGEHKADVY